MLSDPTGAERALLGAVAYQANEAVLHTDERLLPRRRAAWASWNYHLVNGASRPTLTYWMNNLQSLHSDTNLCVTLNLAHRIDPEKVIARIPYAHPVFTAEAMAAQKRHGEISGVRRTHYCGAYWASGFHEDGVVSALRALDRVGSSEPLRMAA
jgi:predicted NAD/FAD-binding protein